MRCPVCGSERLSPLGELVARGASAFALQLLFSAPRFFSRAPRFAVEFSRACLDCGAVTAFLSEDERRRLAEAGDSLRLPDWRA